MASGPSLSPFGKRVSPERTIYLPGSQRKAIRRKTDRGIRAEVMPRKEPETIHEWNPALAASKKNTKKNFPRLGPSPNRSQCLKAK